MMDSSLVRFTVIPAVYIIFRDGDKVLLLRRANTGYHDGEYSLPAGHVDGGEPAIQAACREAREEVDVTIQSEDLRLVHTMHRLSQEPELHERIDLFFEAEKWSGELRNVEPEKCDELRWTELSDLPTNVIPEVQQALAAYAVNEPYSSFGF
jgi:8-oxo-dGTP diphosphatase